MSITIRTETPGDVGTIADLVARTYADVPHSDHCEHVMVDRLRGTDAHVPGPSLLAEIGDEAVGQVLLIKACIRSNRVDVPTLALAPLSVPPGFRNRGTGKLLVRTALVRAAALGFESVVVVGIPGYYGKLGFERLGRHPITLPFHAPDENR